MARPRKPPKERFDLYWQPEPNSGCWLWIGDVHPETEYGRFWMTPEGTQQAHRASWTIHKGPIPDGLFVLHSCDVKPCVNPDHLFLGTGDDNMDDMVAKSRQCRGTKVNTAKLSESQVLAIVADQRGQKAICREYGISRSMFYYIKNGEFWNWLTKIK